MSKKSDTSNVRLKVKERLNFFSDLSTMLTAGIPILDAIESMQEDAKGNQKKVLSRIRTALYNGEPLSKAMMKMPKAFDPVSINLIRVAEAGGTLETTMHDIVTSTKKEMSFSQELRNTMVYPLVVMVVFTGIVVLMLTFVIPRIATVFRNLNVKTPWITIQMIKISKIFIADWPLIVSVIVVLIVLIGLFIKANKRLIIRLILSLPMLRTLGTNIDLTRFTRSLGLLMDAGVPIVEALDLSERVITKKSILTIVRQMKTDVAEGKPMTASLGKGNSEIPIIMSRSIRTAETSGTLTATLINLTEYFDEQVTESLKVLSSLVEPVLIVVVGILVGALMMSIIAPIYSMISQINVKSK